MADRGWGKYVDILFLVRAVGLKQDPSLDDSGFPCHSVRTTRAWPRIGLFEGRGNCLRSIGDPHGPPFHQHPDAHKPWTSRPRTSTFLLETYPRSRPACGNPAHAFEMLWPRLVGPACFAGGRVATSVRGSPGPYEQGWRAVRRDRRRRRQRGSGRRGGQREMRRADAIDRTLLLPRRGVDHAERPHLLRPVHAGRGARRRAQVLPGGPAHRRGHCLG